MASKIKPCTGGKRHSWKFIKNVNVGNVKITIGGPSTASFRLQGLYGCTVCKARKYGQYLPSSEEV